MFNTVTGKTSELTPQTDTDETTLEQVRGLKLEKTADKSTYSVVGETITYQYVLTNTGNVILSAPFTLTDDILGDIDTSSISALQPGESKVLTAEHEVTQDDLDNGMIVNKANASSGNTLSNEAKASVKAIQTIKLEIDKSAQQLEYKAVGDVITYKYEITNTGNVTLDTNLISVEDDKIGTIEINSVPDQLAPGESFVAFGTHIVSQADIDEGSIKNIATVGYGEKAYDEDDFTISIEQLRLLKVDKRADRPIYSNVGEVITYTYTVTNVGNIALNGEFIVNDDKLGLITSTLIPSSLQPQEGFTVTATHTVTQEDIENGSIVNVVTVSSTGEDMSPVSDEEIVVAAKNPSLTIVKTADKSRYESVGERIVYTITVTNTGNTELTGVTVVDPMITLIGPSGDLNSNGVLDVGETWTYNGVYNVTADDIRNRDIVNVATVRTSQTDPKSDSEVLTLYVQPFDPPFTPDPDPTPDPTPEPEPEPQPELPEDEEEIEEDPVPEAQPEPEPEPEAQPEPEPEVKDETIEVPEEPLPQAKPISTLPKTGTASPLMTSGFGTLLLAAGLFLRKRRR